MTTDIISRNDELDQWRFRMKCGRVIALLHPYEEFLGEITQQLITFLPEGMKKDLLISVTISLENFPFTITGNSKSSDFITRILGQRTDNPAELFAKSVCSFSRSFSLMAIPSSGRFSIHFVKRSIDGLKLNITSLQRLSYPVGSLMQESD